jgi:hypothetical protein
VVAVGQKGIQPAEDLVRHGRAVTGFWLPLLGTVAVIAIGWESEQHLPGRRASR